MTCILLEAEHADICPSLCFIRCCNLEISSTAETSAILIEGKCHGRTRLLFLCVFHLIAKKFNQNEENVFIPYGGCEMSVILNTHPFFFVSVTKNKLSVAKESARLVDSAVFS